MRITIHHATSYRYDGTARAIQALRLTPLSGRSQTVAEWAITLPDSATATSYIDAFGNPVDLIASRGPVEALEIVAAGVVETSDTAGVVGFTNEAVVPDVFLRATPLTPRDPEIAAFARSCLGEATLTTLHAILDGLHARVAYDTSATDSTTTAAAAFAQGRGVCQDHAHIFTVAARALGIPARYVTGYLLLDAEGGSAAHHAWAEAMVPDIGWVGFDPANGQCPTERYVRLASGLDAVSAAPIRGVRQGTANERLRVTVTVRQEQEQSQDQDQQQGQRQQ